MLEPVEHLLDAIAAHERALRTITMAAYGLLVIYSAQLEVATWSDPQAGWGVLAILAAWPWLGGVAAAWLAGRWRRGHGSGWVVVPVAVFSVPVISTIAIAATRYVGGLLGRV